MTRSAATQQSDLFWEPKPTDMVRLKPAARVGVRPFDDHPLRVLSFSDIGGIRLFTCETTGPIRECVTRSGRTVTERPSWHGFFQADQLTPDAAERNAA